MLIRLSGGELPVKGKLLGPAIVGSAFGVAPPYMKNTNGQTVSSEHISFVRDISWNDLAEVGS